MLFRSKNKKHNIEIVVDRLVIKEDIHRRLTDSVETAAALAIDPAVFESLGQVTTVTTTED